MKFRDILEAEKPFEVKYQQGMKGTWKVKKFKNQKAYEKWFDKNETDITVDSFRDLNESKFKIEDLIDELEDDFGDIYEFDLVRLDGEYAIYVDEKATPKMIRLLKN